MKFKLLTSNIVLLVFLLSSSDAQGQGGGRYPIRSSTSSSGDSSYSGANPLLGLLLILLCCGTGIARRIYHRYETEERLANTAPYRIVFVPAESAQEVSTKPITTEIDHQEVQYSNGLQQPNNVEEKCPMIVPNKDNETSPSCTK
ncbi:unnamed protein product [Rotaria magnacalcarata]|uniref:Uncharacterized protein n=1 Tax=Rotaria magnacalcarata TaxID=392030 RepID=A0A819MHC4_9BILA|nr:unnamed protein product [Rotaria magnacalcarata]